VTIPREVAPIGDCVFSGLVEAAKLSFRETSKITVNYTCMWEGVYRRFKETPPPGAKPDIDFVAVMEWLASVPEERRRVLARLCGGDLVPWAQKTLAEIRAQRPKAP
jgi:hypothetical protein